MIYVASKIREEEIKKRQKKNREEKKKERTEKRGVNLYVISCGHRVDRAGLLLELVVL